VSFRFVDIDGIVDHHCLNFFFFIMVLYVLLQVNSFSNISFKIIPVILHWKKVNTNNLMVGDYRGGGAYFYKVFNVSTVD
jgi:inorganic pyrophosphatase/exopolyphosphatase